MKPFYFIHASSDKGANKQGSSQGPVFIKKNIKNVQGTWSDPIFSNKKVPSYAVKEVCKKIHDETLSVLDNHFPVLVGGDHSVAMGSIWAVSEYAKRVDRPLYVLWIDAHADINTNKTSLTGNLHGMPVAMLTGIDQSGWVLPLRAHIKKSNIFLVGLRSIDFSEKIILKNHNIKWVGDGVLNYKKEIEMWFDTLPEDALLHVSFDLDSMDPDLAPGVSTPVKGGLTIDSLSYLFDKVKNSGKLFSMDIVEYNPFYEKENKSLKVIEALLQFIQK